MNSKTVLVLIFFVLMIVVFVGGAIGNTDLTPAAIRVPGEDKVVALPNGPVAPQPVIAGVSMGSGSCPNPYTVQKGDTLSAIARNCGLSLKDLIASNPAIVNPNLIHIGQQINIYYPLNTVVAATMQIAPTAVAATVAAPTSVPNTGNAAIPETAVNPPSPTATLAPSAPTAAALPTQPLPLAPATTSAPITTHAPNGLRPGGSFDIVAKDLPPNAVVQVSIGKQGSPANVVGEGKTDANGTVKVDMQIPSEAKPGDKWVVIIVARTGNAKMLISPPFVIEQ